VAEALLSIQGLRKHYGGLAVTNDVSLEVYPGEIHALIGPNGAGKTTLIHQITGTVTPDAGRVVFAGVDITRLSLPACMRAWRAAFRSPASSPAFPCWKMSPWPPRRKADLPFGFFVLPHRKKR
jgi:branched-chain amino acid transport system ATP-binding protein